MRFLPYKLQVGIALSIPITFFIASCISLTMICRNILDYDFFKDDIGSNLSKLVGNEHGWSKLWTIGSLLLLSLLLTYYYCNLRYNMNKFLDDGLLQEKRRINCLFITVLIAYFVRSLVCIALHWAPDLFIC